MKRILLLAALFAGATAAAKVSLPEIVGPGMILQQNAEARLWGWADPGATVKIETSWGEKAAVRSGADGRWLAAVPTPAGSYEPRSITIASGEKLTLDNILIGEVWFAGGQSNMEMPLDGFWNCPVEGANEAIMRAGERTGKIRYVKVPRVHAAEPQERVAGAWQEFTPATAPRCTAVGYFFASLLNDVLDVPVGIIDCSWGGSRVEGWLDRATLERYNNPKEELTEEAYSRLPDPCHYPLLKYNGMVHPLTDYTIRGFIWYQGESNIGGHGWYASRMADLVALWRDLWRGGELPFYFVEIAPYEYGTGDMAARLREAQAEAARTIPNSGMVSTNDLVYDYEAPNIHPADKRRVGERLAAMALGMTYGVPNIAVESPEFRSMEVRDGVACVSLSHAETGFDRMTGIEGFEICGPDRVFHPARVAIGPAPAFELLVSSEEVSEPVAVRYCFRDFQIGNLHNTRGLPVIPFRTDDF